jgi:hypothetical protein
VTDPDQDEFVALRRRAYGRDADIHLDPASLARLDELENARHSLPNAAPDAVVEPAPSVVESPVESTTDDPLPDPWWVAGARRVGPGIARLGRWLRGLSRSTVLIALGAGLIVATLLTVLTVVQRVQTDPLQVGAVQVARLAVDTGFESPFPDSGSAGGSLEEARGYQEFHGLRAIQGGQNFFYAYGAGADSVCLIIYVESTLDVQNGGFSGSLYSACSAGDFPPILQLPLDLAELPNELVAAYPDAGGIQFVYDVENDEVVVFTDR